MSPSLTGGDESVGNTGKGAGAGTSEATGGSSRTTALGGGVSICGAGSVAAAGAAGATGGDCDAVGCGAGSFDAIPGSLPLVSGDATSASKDGRSGAAGAASTVVGTCGARSFAGTMAGAGLGRAFTASLPSAADGAASSGGVPATSASGARIAVSTGAGCGERGVVAMGAGGSVLSLELIGDSARAGASGACVLAGMASETAGPAPAADAWGACGWFTTTGGSCASDASPSPVVPRTSPHTAPDTAPRIHTLTVLVTRFHQQPGVARPVFAWRGLYRLQSSECTPFLNLSRNYPTTGRAAPAKGWYRKISSPILAGSRSDNRPRMRRRKPRPKKGAA